MNIFKNKIFRISVILSLAVLFGTVMSFASDYEISGSFTAYNNGFETSIKIMQRDETVSEITLDPAIEKGKNTETFSISVPSGGEYDLVISKPGALSYKITGITVNGNIDLTASGYPEISSPELIPGDLTGDGFIDGLDVSQIAFDMGKSPAQATYPASDLNGDGFRDALDVSLIAFNLLKTAQSAEYPSQTKKLQLCTFEEVGALTTNIGSNLEA